MKLSDKLAKVNESLLINRYDNGYMVEISGKTSGGDWVTTKTVFGTMIGVFDLLCQYDKLPKDD
jgi:hypothetical protein